jgi:hypothetical protein
MHMVPVVSLAIPILLSAVFVFIASSIIHMVLPIHRNDFRKLSDEDNVMEALRRFKIAPGDYLMPAPGSPAAMKDPAFLAKRDKGPIVVMTVLPPGPPSMGMNLVQWFLYSVLVSVFAAYIAGRALGPGAHYLEVFRFAGASAFMGYSLGLIPQSIWFKKAWSSTIKSVIDGLVYALLTAGTFGWLWPEM